MRPLKKAFWFVVALLFLIEAKLYDWTAPLFARLIRLLALDRFKAWIARAVVPLPAPIVLVIFLVPLALVEPPKVVALWLMAEGHFITGIVTLAVAEILGLAAVALLFEACKPKLMSIRWFARTYEWFHAVKAWALLQVEPLLRRARTMLKLLRRALDRRMRLLFPGGSEGGLWRRLSMLRRRARAGG